MAKDPFQQFLMGAGGISSPAALASAQSAVREEAAARSNALRQNAGLLRFDASQYEKVGGEVFSTERRKSLQRTASAGGQYVGSGVRLEGSARDVMRDIDREGMREATAQRNQYVYQARRALKEADIYDYRAQLETMAGEFEAQSIQENARQQFEIARARYISSGKATAQRAASVHPWSLQAGVAAQTLSQYQSVATTANPFSGGDDKAALESARTMMGDIGGFSQYYI